MGIQLYLTLTHSCQMDQVIVLSKTLSQSFAILWFYFRSSESIDYHLQNSDSILKLCPSVTTRSWESTDYHLQNFDSSSGYSYHLISLSSWHLCQRTLWLMFILIYYSKIIKNLNILVDSRFLGNIMSTQWIPLKKASKFNFFLSLISLNRPVIIGCNVLVPMKF